MGGWTSTGAEEGAVGGIDSLTRHGCKGLTVECLRLAPTRCLYEANGGS